jgi:gliding motility-associated-like protein
VNITIRPDPLFAIGAGGSVCEKDSIQLTASGGNVYAWQPATSVNNPAIANPKVSPAITTTYTVSITETACNNSTVLQTTVTVNPLPTVKATKENDLDCSNDNSQLNATGASSYTWTPAGSLDNPGIANPVATPTINTKYIVKGTDALGCSNYDSVTVEFLSVNASGYYMPNAFTPNRDGLNDCYGIKYWGLIQKLEFSIYNRWGERIFFTNNPNDCWNGSYKGVMQPIGVYVYMIKAKTLCGDTFKKGLFVLAK